MGFSFVIANSLMCNADPIGKINYVENRIKLSLLTKKGNFISFLLSYIDKLEKLCDINSI